MEHAGESGVQLSIAYGPATMEHAGESGVQLSIAYETGHHGACW